MRIALAVALVALAAAPAGAQTASYWTYDVTNDGKPGFATVSEGSEPFAGSPAVFLETVTVSADGDAHATERAYFRQGPAGVSYLGSRTASESGAGGSQEERNADTPELVLPAPLASATKWDTTATLQLAITRGADPASHATASTHELAELIGRETITVPAGTFECVAVKRTASTQTSETMRGIAVITEELATTTAWYAPSIGLVKLTATSSVEVTRGGVSGGKHDTSRTMQLRSHHLAAPAWQMQAVGFVDRPVDPCADAEAAWKATPEPANLLALADCHQRAGKIATAWTEYRNAKATDRADALAPRVAKLHVVPPARAVPELVVRRDGADITALLDTQMPIDPGAHQLTASAPGYVTWTASVQIADEGKLTELPVPPLAKIDLMPKQDVVTETAPAPAVDLEARANKKRLGFQITGAGVATMLLAGTFGVLANNNWSTAQMDCGGNVDACPAGSLAMAQSATDSASMYADLATVTFVVGAAATAVGAYILARNW